MQLTIMFKTPDSKTITIDNLERILISEYDALPKDETDGILEITNFQLFFLQNNKQYSFQGKKTVTVLSDNIAYLLFQEKGEDTATFSFT